jgi:hypothetical protein
MGTRLRNRRRYVSMATICVLIFATSSGSRAATAQCGALQSYLVGAYSEETNYGARAEIEKHKPDLCSRKSVSVAWSMIGGGTTSDDVDGYAQVGYGRFGENSSFDEAGMKVFTQTAKYLGGDPKTRFFPKPTGTLLYEVDYLFTDGKLHMYVDGDQVAKTNWDPAIAWTGTWSTQFFGETKHSGSDVPGTEADPVGFTSIEKKTRDGSWVGVPGLTLAESPLVSRYFKSWISQPDSFEIWTDPV